MDRLHSMRVFTSAVGTGSLAGAARALNMSPAAATRLLTDLEEHLGARLLNRGTRGLRLTEIGERYLERVQHILGAIDEAEALVGSATSEARGHLRVLAPPAFAVHQLAPLLPGFRARHPGIDLAVDTPGPVETVDENVDVSVVVVARAALDGSFVARRLARSQVVLCAAAAYLDRRGRPREPHDLEAHDTMLPHFMHELVLRQGVDGRTVRLKAPAAVLGTAHLELMHASARAGLGICALPSFVAARSLREQALERVLPHWHLGDVEVHAAMPTRKHVPARTRVFIDFLVRAFGGEDRDPWLG